MSSLRSSVRMTRALRATAPRAFVAAPRMGVRAYSTPAEPKSSNTPLLLAALLAGAGAAYYMRDDLKNVLGGASNKVPSKEDYETVYKAIAEALEKDSSYDDGSYAPVVLRLAWHSSGTYDKETNSGGSNGATMRFQLEATHDGNAGLEAARNFMEPIKAKFPWISYSDLWTLGGVVAIQEMGGPKIPWRPGRVDKPEDQTPPNGRLPDGAKGQDHVRNVFHRMGFNDQETVALIGAHAVGRCHSNRSGFDGPWTFSPTSFTNQFYVLLLEEGWVPKKWDGPFQYVDKNSGSLMMLPSDYSLIKDSSFKKYVQEYAKDEDKFFKDFSKAFSTLLELGVPAENFAKGAEGLGTSTPLIFKATSE
ncbi:heme peroxidase [Malassezia pachydermatis]|uniref:Peroxidase n=1 Tax=Malassezia pachydermatis TaxID=77020 RepID=A0A0N0RSA1_9BASI|nr:cytochrome c peroxidase [Malassezia pachydermatis]KOS14472.1 cytochrome c peroxidase [Malassezia pachydermatis]